MMEEIIDRVVIAVVEAGPRGAAWWLIASWTMNIVGAAWIAWLTFVKRDR